ncbi:cardiolipin synthase [Sedimentitalea sp. HM32M-2]|uniref:cardiolipin synthase n=1 Tax=Sedimentitalea sp. HM32M-2 TaxID=3351566 RepID=UPI0036374DC2
MWATLGGLLVFLTFAAGAYCALRAAQTARTAQGAVGWVVFLIAAPYLALPAYLFLGQHRYRDYRTARRESTQVRQRIENFAVSNAPAPDSTDLALAPFEYCANMPAFRGNGARLLIDGEATFQALFAAIDAAQTYVLVQFYIVRDDDLGRELQQRLLAAARRGVTVRFMTDALGSARLPDSYCDALRAAGVQVMDRHAARGARFRFRINFRNHRKTVIVDGVTGFTGGLNVGDEYLGRDPDLGPWRDTHVQLHGPMVSQLQLIFVEDWHWISNETLIGQLNWQAPFAPEDAPGLIVATGPGDITETGGLMFFSAIAAARRRIWLASPYFVPDIDILTALRHAALRGVDVRVLVPDMADHRITWLAAFAYFDDIREAGVRVFRYTGGFMHQKVFVVDDGLAAIGTTNLDNRSFRLNFETMALFFDPPMARQVDAMLRQDFLRSYELTCALDQQHAFLRYGAPLARLFAPLL